MKGERRRISQADLEEVIRRIVQTAQPDRIILFGSAARGVLEADSDLDLLVIKGGAFNRNHLLGEIYRRLRGVHVAVDVLLATPEEIEQYARFPFLVIAPALEEGKEVYRAGEVAPD
ncbi:MAG: nucleotidyltransferase domain-containing protein [Firmicutes bacterium]|nr:nucleotidyltransferase domain-containing protein [Bacillota bacterium]